MQCIKIADACFIPKGGSLATPIRRGKVMRQAVLASF